MEHRKKGKRAAFGGKWWIALAVLAAAAAYVLLTAHTEEPQVARPAAGAGAVPPVPGRLIPMVRAAVSHVDSYRFNVSAVARLSGKASGGYVSATLGVLTDGVASLRNRWMRSDVSVLLDTTESGSSVIQDRNITLFILNDYMYSKPQDLWFKQRINQSKLVWNNLTHPEQHLQLLENARITSITPDVIDGRPVWRADVVPEGEALMRYLELATSGGGIGGSTVAADSVRSARIWIWVDNETFLPVRSDILADMRSGDLSTQMEIYTNLFDYNGYPAINIPDEVSGAIEDPSTIR